MSDDYILKYSNGYANYTGKINEDELIIDGDCKITNYDPRFEDGKKQGQITIDFNFGSEEIKDGTGSGYNNRTQADFSNKKYSIFSEIAALSGDKNELSISDIKKMDKSFIEKWGLQDLRLDFKAGVATLVWGENDILRIDFVTKKDKKMQKNVEKVENVKFENINDVDLVEEDVEITKNIAVNNFKIVGGVEDFLNDLGGQETKGKLRPYFVMNDFGFVGRYQMGEQAMVEMGIYKKEPDPKTGKINYNNDWTGVFLENKYGIKSLWDYRNSPDKQELLQIDYKKRDWQYIKNKDLLKFIGTTVNDVVITESGLLAGAHLVGAGGLSKYLKHNGTIDVTDRPNGKGTSVLAYLKQFANYDVSAITDSEL